MSQKQFPHQQPFNVTPKYNKSNKKGKKNSWWIKYRVNKKED